ncbi:aspartate aminotransferase family protein [Verrucomicrobiales bacterium]|nr:aspartate aminotransferase family protein [Verrucomicrobiales bacterium]
MLPKILTEIPGPKSRQLGEELQKYESRNITFISEKFPIFWDSADGINVWDVDGNRFLDLTSAFAVSSLGHRNQFITDALIRQAGKLLHGMGDVHPTELKVELCKKISELTYERWIGVKSKSVLSSSGSESIECALKTALLATGKEGVICFKDSYHGTSIGALATSGIARFREPFTKQIAQFGITAPYGIKGLSEVHNIISSNNIGAIIVEPILGRGGKVVPEEEFLPEIREICDKHNIVLILDEIYTGFNRTGKLFACEHWNVVPDIICLGKALAGGFPLSICTGKPNVMDAWPVSDGEAIHTSTFLGNPMGCAMALEALSIHTDPATTSKVNDKSAFFINTLEKIKHPYRGKVRGKGLMLGLEILDDSGNPNGKLATSLINDSLQAGIITLADGPNGHVLALTPPFNISDEEILWTSHSIEKKLKISN